MMFTKSFLRRTDKASSAKRELTAHLPSDNAKVTYDLLAILTYMAALSSAESNRDRVFEGAITQSNRTAVYFRQVYILVKRLGFEYTRAFQLVAKKAGAPIIQSLLLRFAASINSGESELSFLSQEARVQRETYNSNYNRALESLQKWTDAYAALIVSVSVIVVVAMVSTMIYDAGQAFVVLLSLTTIVITAMSAYIIYSNSPYELTTYNGRTIPRFRKWAIRLFFLLVPIGVISAYFLGKQMGGAFAYLALGFSLAPSGIAAMLDDAIVTKVDGEVSSFIRAVGSITGSLGSTLTVGIMRIDIRSMGHLEPYLLRLRSRLARQLDPDLCWEVFRCEVGSELVSRTSRMLVDGIALGGNGEIVGAIASDYSLNIALLQARRRVVSATFAFLSFPLHAAMVGLLIFILEVIKSFNIRLKQIADQVLSQVSSGASGAIPDLPMFHSRDLSLISTLMMAVIVAFTIANSLAPKFATGGHWTKFSFYGSVMCILSGVTLLAVPAISHGVLK